MKVYWPEDVAPIAPFTVTVRGAWDTAWSPCSGPRPVERTSEGLRVSLGPIERHDVVLVEANGSK